MSIRHLLLLSILIAPCATQALAQQPAQPTPNKLPVAPLLGIPAPAPDWHTQIPAFRPNVPASIQTQQLPTLQSHTLDRLRAAAQRTKLQLLAQNDSTCYAIRDYQLKQEDPTSDATRLSGYTTCVPRAADQKKNAAAVHLRGAVLTR